MKEKNKNFLDKVLKELIYRIEEKEKKQIYGILDVKLRLFKGELTQDVDIDFKETIKLN